MPFTRSFELCNDGTGQTECGFNDATNARMLHQQAHQEVHQAITALASLKTASLSNFLLGCKKRLKMYETINSYYNDNLWSSKLRFKCYMRKQKTISEIVKRFTYNSLKYHKNASTNVKTATKKHGQYYPPSPLDSNTKPTETIIAYGNGSFGASMRGKRPGPVQHILKALQKHSSSNNIIVCMVDEYLTSQVCHICKERNVENVNAKGPKRRVHSVLQCQTNTCNTVWNRDVMAAKNILDIFLHAANNNDARLPQFQRSSSE